jgi:hypothetical protein
MDGCVTYVQQDSGMDGWLIPISYFPIFLIFGSLFSVFFFYKGSWAKLGDSSRGLCSMSAS